MGKTDRENGDRGDEPEEENRGTGRGTAGAGLGHGLDDGRERDEEKSKVAEGGVELLRSGLLHFGAYFKDLPLYQGKEDLCRRSKCPSHRSGKFMFKAVEKLPRYTPQGVYQIQVKAEDEHGKEIVCARAKLPVMPEV